MNARSPVKRWLSSLATISINAIMQAVGLLIFARTLGPAEYSIIVATTAVAAISAEFVGFGAGDLLIREVSRNPSAHRSAFGRALRLIALSIVPVALMGTLVAQFWFRTGATFQILLALVVSEIVSTRIVFMTEQIAIAHHETHAANANRIFATVVRFAIICIAVTAGQISTAADWAIFAIASALIAAVGTLLLTIRRFGSPDLRAPFSKNLRTGALFSMMQVVRAVQFSIDKFAIGMIAPAATVGSFGVASRVAQLGILPAIAVTRITYPSFFAKGAEGLPAALGFARRIAPAVIGIGIVSSVGVAMLAFALPYLFGPGFSSTRHFVLVMSVLPLIAGLQNLAGDMLSGADFQHVRLVAGIVGLTMLALSVAVGAIGFGLAGAIIGYMVGQLLFTLVSWASILRLLRYQP